MLLTHILLFMTSNVKRFQIVKSRNNRRAQVLRCHNAQFCHRFGMLHSDYKSSASITFSRTSLTAFAVSAPPSSSARFLYVESIFSLRCSSFFSADLTDLSATDSA